MIWQSIKNGVGKPFWVVEVREWDKSRPIYSKGDISIAIEFDGALYLKIRGGNPVRCDELDMNRLGAIYFGLHNKRLKT